MDIEDHDGPGDGDHAGRITTPLQSYGDGSTSDFRITRLGPFRSCDPFRLRALPGLGIGQGPEVASESPIHTTGLPALTYC